MQDHHSSPLRLFPFWTGWILANLLGGALGGVLEARLQFLGTLVLVGTAVGFLQLFFLQRQQLARATLWACVLVVGWPLGNLLRVALSDYFVPLIQTLTLRGWLWEVFWLNALEMPVTLAVIGIGQGLVLTPRWRTVPGWLLINLLGGSLLGATGATVCLHFCAPLTNVAGMTVTGLVLGALSWGAYALVTGPVLFRLLRNMKQT